MSNLQFLAHAGHDHHNQNTVIKGTNALVITGIAVLIVAAVILTFYAIGRRAKHAKVRVKKSSPKE